MTEIIVKDPTIEIDGKNISLFFKGAFNEDVRAVWMFEVKDAAEVASIIQRAASIAAWNGKDEPR